MTKSNSPAIAKTEIPAEVVGHLAKIAMHLVTAGRMNLAIHRMEQDNKQGGCLSSPAQLLAWEAFDAIDEAMEKVKALLKPEDPTEFDYEA